MIKARYSSELRDGNKFLYFYDKQLKLWTLYLVNAQNDQISAAEFYQTRDDVDRFIDWYKNNS